MNGISRISILNEIGERNQRTTILVVKIKIGIKIILKDGRGDDVKSEDSLAR